MSFFKERWKFKEKLRGMFSVRSSSLNIVSGSAS